MKLVEALEDKAAARQALTERNLEVHEELQRQGTKRPESRPAEMPAATQQAESLPVGTRVRLRDSPGTPFLKYGTLGTVRVDAAPRQPQWVGVEWDGLTSGNDLNGACKAGAGWWVDRKRLDAVTPADEGEAAARDEGRRRVLRMSVNPGTTPGGREAREEARRRFIESRRGADRAARKAKPRLRYNPETGRLEKR